MPTRILIADDNLAVRTALRQLLESADHWEIIDVENGREAIAKAQELRPQLIVLDLVMPVMDGLAAARELSKLLPQIPLLMHTMHWSPQLQVEAQKVNVRKVVPKADSKGLISSIQELLTSESASTAVATSAALPVIATPDVAALPPVTESAQAPAPDQPDSEAGAQADLPPALPQA